MAYAARSTSLLLLMACTAAFLAPTAPAAERVQAWEGTLTIPTYPWEPEDVNPRFFEYEGSIIYPYTMQDNLAATKTDRTYKALFLENEYLKVTCLPELGGRIHSVLDKTTNQETFHLNKVIKPGLIAMRGAWISGGIEWNSGPHGHTVTIVSPVDAFILENPDGSASLVIGNTDKILRTRWTVRLTLRPGKAYLEEQIRLFNPTDGMHPYYFWNNTAFPCKPGTRYIYPMSLGTDHNGTQFFSWPVHEGRDMTWLKNYPDMTSTFAYNCVHDFFGAYDVDDDRGIVQYANHGILPGKKAWTWGQSDFGLVSQESLTEDDGPYIEVQSGPLATQSDYEFLAPRQQVSWEEWWYPVHGLGDGFEYATRDVAVQTARRDGSLELRVYATGDFPAAELRVRRNGEVHEQALDLSPKTPQVVQVPVPADAADAPQHVTIATSDGAILAAFTTPLPIPKVDPPVIPEPKPEDQLTVEEVYLKGLRFDKDTNRTGAREWYEKVLAKDPEHADALRALAVLDLETGLYPQALERLQKVVARRPADSLAWALMGLAHLRLDRPDEALEAAYRGARLIDAAALGFDVAGRARMRRGEYRKAVTDFQRALQASPHDTRAHEHLMLAFLRGGQLEEALDTARMHLRIDPLAILPRMILGAPDRQRMQNAVREAQAFIGEDEFLLLDAAFVCADMAMPEFGRALLDLADSAGFTALAAYHRAWFAERQGDPDAVAAHLQEARQASPDYVFPSFPESIDVLRFAADKDPADSHARLFLGNLYAGLGRIDEAVACWQEAAKLDPSLSVALRNLAMHAWKKQNDLEAAQDLFAKAIQARPDDEVLYRDRAHILIALNRRNEAIDLLAGRPIGDRARADATLLLVRCYVDEKRYDDALNILQTAEFSNWEGQTESWDLFNRALVERGKLRLEANDPEAALQDFTTALTYPKNLRVGRPVHPREAEAQYWKGKALQTLGRTDEARAAWQEGAAGHPGSEAQNKHIDLCKQALEQPAT